VAQVSIKINDTAVQAVFATAIARLGDLTPMMADVGEMLVNSLDRGFRDQVDPYQTSWAPLAASTLRQKVRRKRILKINQSSGILRATLSYQASSTKVLVGYNTPYATYIQTGTRRMPKRQILPDTARGLPLNLQNEIVNIVKDHLDL
jgi:phage gpG-like protein